MRAISNNRSKRKKGTLFLRGFSLLKRYTPGLLRLVVLHSVTAAITPYILIVLSMYVLTTLEQSSETVWIHVAVLLGTAVVLGIFDAVFKRTKEAAWEMLYRAAQRILADAYVGLDHKTAVDPATGECLSEVKRSIESLGNGLVRLPDVLQNTAWGGFGLLAACCGFRYTFANDVLAGVLFGLSFLLAAVCSFWLSFGFTRRCVKDTDEVVRLDRRYYAFYDIAFLKKEAADIRLYRQDACVMHHLEETEKRAFQKDGSKHRKSYGARGWMQALSVLPFVLWLGAISLYASVRLGEAGFGFGIAVQTIALAVAAVRDADRLCLGIQSGISSRVYLEQLYRFLDTPPQMYRGSLTTEKRSDNEYTLEIKGVSFRYPSQTKTALCDVSVTIPSGRRLAVVGENGSGKSTFVKLLSRLYDPQEGAVLLNGIDIRKYRPEEYAALFSVVFQESQLLARSIGENVACNVDYDSERVLRCLNDVGLHAESLDRPLDLSTLSVGDAQKLSIAKALYKEAPFLLLDEPTASLDAAAEAELYEKLDRIAGKRTVIFISHRLSSCRFCDEILVFDQGHLVQRGSHDTLVAERDGIYRRLWSAQARHYN